MLAVGVFTQVEAIFFDRSEILAPRDTGHPPDGFSSNSGTACHNRYMTESLRTGKYAPRDLQTSEKALWHRIFDSYTLDPAEEVLLHQLCRVTDNLDRIAADLSEM